MILRVKMQEIMKTSEMVNLYGDLAKDFRMSDRWLSCFMKRYKLSWRRYTKIFQKLLNQTEELLAKFHQFITRLRTEKSFELYNILNMDETLMWFNMTGNFTVN